MLLLADGGSTKCDWILLNEAKEEVFRTQTKGLNPSVFSEKIIRERVEANTALQEFSSQIQQVDFYGAGCGTPLPQKKLKSIFEVFFKKAQVNIFEDTYAAVYAATSMPGIVCILGTGSNSCYFDGKKIHTPIASLGFVVMDEASGNYFGKKLIQDYFYKKMPSKIAKEFEAAFNLDPDEIKFNLYQQENPNAYLASFAAFIFSKNEINPYFEKIITEGIQVFIENRILPIQESAEVPIHFVGSIAHFSEKIIKNSLKTYNLAAGNIIRHPIDQLTQYYQKK
ncbi:N-acetylglucosamine kinase [Mesonia aquimarina]|uniref:N-acetylglucosamine kinase n=1 Tax=Mesonia aquimarina TaxID=1504967 RepID=UPI000EF61830|nr:N-acetylglucosamine kinase [Mesonia aquimarina]